MIKIIYNNTKSKQNIIVFDLCERFEFAPEMLCDAISLHIDEESELVYLYTGFKDDKSSRFEYGYYNKGGIKFKGYPNSPIETWDLTDDIKKELYDIGLEIIERAVAKKVREIGKRDNAYIGSELYEVIDNNNKKNKKFVALLANKNRTSVILLNKPDFRKKSKSAEKKEWSKNFINQSQTKTKIKNYRNVCFNKFGIFSIER